MLGKPCREGRTVGTWWRDHATPGVFAPATVGWHSRGSVCGAMTACRLAVVIPVQVCNVLCLQSRRQAVEGASCPCDPVDARGGAKPDEMVGRDQEMAASWPVDSPASPS